MEYHRRLLLSEENKQLTSNILSVEQIKNNCTVKNMSR